MSLFVDFMLSIYSIFALHSLSIRSATLCSSFCSSYSSLRLALYSPDNRRNRSLLVATWRLASRHEACRAYGRRYEVPGKVLSSGKIFRGKARTDDVLSPAGYPATLKKTKRPEGGRSVREFTRVRRPLDSGNRRG